MHPYCWCCYCVTYGGDNADGVFITTRCPEHGVESHSEVAWGSVTSVCAVSSSEHVVSRQQDAAASVAAEELQRSLAEKNRMKRIFQMKLHVYVFNLTCHGWRLGSSTGVPPMMCADGEASARGKTQRRRLSMLLWSLLWLLKSTDASTFSTLFIPESDKDGLNLMSFPRAFDNSQGYSYQFQNVHLRYVGWLT